MPRPSRDEESLLSTKSENFLTDFGEPPSKWNFFKIVLVECQFAGLIQNLFGDQMLFGRLIVRAERILLADVSVLVSHSTLVTVLGINSIELV